MPKSDKQNHKQLQRGKSESNVAEPHNEDSEKKMSMKSASLDTGEVDINRRRAHDCLDLNDNSSVVENPNLAYEVSATSTLSDAPKCFTESEILVDLNVNHSSISPEIIISETNIDIATATATLNTAATDVVDQDRQESYLSEEADTAGGAPTAAPTAAPSYLMTPTTDSSSPLLEYSTTEGTLYTGEFSDKNSSGHLFPAVPALEDTATEENPTPHDAENEPLAVTGVSSGGRADDGETNPAVDDLGEASLSGKVESVSTEAPASTSDTPAGKKKWSFWALFRRSSRSNTAK